MTIAFDAISGDLSFQGTDITISHTPVGTPRGALLLTVQGDTSDDTIDGATYGGTSMTEMTGSPYITTGSEPATIYAYLLGSSVSTGTQDCVIDVDGTSRRRQSGIITVTGAADIEENQLTLLVESDAQDDPSGTLALNSTESFVCQAFMSGLSAVGNVSPLTDWTDQLEGDFGSQVGCIYTYDTIGSSDVTCGYTSSAADNVYLLGVAINEAAGGGGGGYTSPLTLTGVG